MSVSVTVLSFDEFDFSPGSVVLDFDVSLQQSSSETEESVSNAINGNAVNCYIGSFMVADCSSKIFKLNHTI